MIFRCIADILTLRWLLYKRKLLSLLPLKSAYIERVSSNDWAAAHKLTSSMQGYVIKGLLGRNVSAVVFKSYNGVLINSLTDVGVSRHLGRQGAYDKGKIEYIKSLLGNDFIVYVIGAHIGSLIVPISRCVRKIYAFEANPLTYELLDWNVKLNGIGNVRIFNYAIYDEETDVSFYLSVANSGGSKIKPILENPIYTYDNPEVIRLNGKVLDKVKNDEGLEFPDLIIMDIEGGEYRAIKGGYECLKHARYLYVEFVPHHLINVANVSLPDFMQGIMCHFRKMKIVDECPERNSMTYEGDSILSKLHHFLENNIDADLLFYNI